MIECNCDCLNCPYPDVPEECLEAPISIEECQVLNDLEIALDVPMQHANAAYRKAYYRANREKLALYNKAYREANREKLAAKQKEYYYDNQKRLLSRQRAYYKANREKLAAKQKVIAVCRKQCGMTQKALANVIGMSPKTIESWESGSTPANWDLLCTAMPELEKYRPREETEQCGRY